MCKDIEQSVFESVLHGILPQRRALHNPIMQKKMIYPVRSNWQLLCFKYNTPHRSKWLASAGVYFA